MFKPSIARITGVCTKCKEAKPPDQFDKSKRHASGHTAQCKTCRHEVIRQWGKRNAWKNREFSDRPAHKVCSKCTIDKPREEFASCASKKDGLSSRCKRCRLDSETANRSSPEYRLKTRLWQLYRLTVPEYEAMLLAQNHCCAICRRRFKPASEGRKRNGTITLAVNIDHCHSSGKVRGLLCSRCNTRLAAIEDTAFITNARKYLRYHGERAIDDPSKFRGSGGDLPLFESIL